MRGTRWLLLVAIAAIVSGLGLTYRAQKRALRAQSPPLPDALPAGLNSKSQGFSYSRTNSDHTTLEVSADDMTEAKDSSRADMKGVTLKLYNKTGDAYDLVKSAAATLFKDEHRFYSEGETEITLALPKTGPPKRTPVTIKSSGVSFDTSTGQANTDRASSFAFENGTGSSTGAFYDPATRVLNLKQDVKLDWKPVGPNAKPMKIEAGALYYREAESEIWLKPWGRLTRGNTVIEGQDATIKLQQAGEGQEVDAKHRRDQGARQRHVPEAETSICRRAPARQFQRGRPGGEGRRQRRGATGIHHRHRGNDHQRQPRRSQFRQQGGRERAYRTWSAKETPS